MSRSITAVVITIVWIISVVIRYLRNCGLRWWQHGRWWRRRIDLFACQRGNVVVHVLHMHRNHVDDHEVFDGQWLLALDLSGFVEGDGGSGKFCCRSIGVLRFGGFDLIRYRFNVVTVIPEIATIARGERSEERR